MLASRKRNLDFAKCSLVKMWLVDTGCGHDLASKREMALMTRFISKAKHEITKGPKSWVGFQETERLLLRSQFQCLVTNFVSALRMELLDSEANGDLIQTLSGILMIMPQTTAFKLLRDRLDCLPTLQR